MKNTLLIASTLIIGFGIIGCDSDDPTPENPEELITTVRLVFQEAGSTDLMIFEFKDLDGDGGNLPIINTDTLLSGREYLLEVELYNESVNPIIDIASEVKEEDDEHQFFFVIDDVNMTHTYEDQDGNGKPLGLLNSMVVGDAGMGSLTIILRHQPDKDAPGVSDGDPTNAGGDTDIEIEFDVSVI